MSYLKQSPAFGEPIDNPKEGENDKCTEPETEDPDDDLEKKLTYVKQVY